MLLQYLAGAPSRAIYVSSWANFSFMAVGGLLASAGPSQRRRSLALPACMLATVALVLFTQTRLRWAVDPAAGRLLFNLLALVIGVALVQHVVAHPVGGDRALESAGPRNLGVVSYGFYVFHNLIPAIPRLGPSPGWAVLSIAAHFAACLALAALSWHALEKRLLGRQRARAPGGNWARRRRSRSSAQARAEARDGARPAGRRAGSLRGEMRAAPARRVASRGARARREPDGGIDAGRSRVTRFTDAPARPLPTGALSRPRAGACTQW